MIEPTQPLIVVSDEKLAKIVDAITRVAGAWSYMNEDSRDEVRSLLIELQDAREYLALQDCP